MAGIGGGELAVIGLSFCMGLGVVLGMVAALVVWGRWVARRQGGGAWSGAAWLPVAAFGVQMAGMCITGASLVRAFSAVDAASPPDRAEALAASISNAMNATAILGGLGSVLFIVSIVVFAIGSIRAPRG